jgi:transcriptional regulator with XRE-family HTH domain
MTFAQTLKYLREIHHVTQEDLAACLKVTRSTIAGYETKGKQPDFDKLLKIASFFEVSLDYLLDNQQQAETIQGGSCNPPQPLLNEYELTFISSLRELSASSRQKLWDYLDLLKVYDEQQNLDRVAEHSLSEYSAQNCVGQHSHDHGSHQDSENNSRKSLAETDSQK